MKIIEQNNSTIYGPVKSWRFGRSIGIDLLFESSICSFNCIYCQLGNIQKHISQRQLFVDSQKIIDDFEKFSKNITLSEYDVITFSGNGEPTLASNIGTIADYLKSKTQKPLILLTNATMLGDKDVQKSIKNIDRIIIKLDSYDQKSLEQVNRPVEDITFEKILKGIDEFKNEYKGELELQMMFMPNNYQNKSKYIEIIKRIKPNTIQLNTPKRAYPLSWHRENRGNHDNVFDYKTQFLKTLTNDELDELKNYILDNIDFKINIFSSNIKS